LGDSVRLSSPRKLILLEDFLTDTGIVFVDSVLGNMSYGYLTDLRFSSGLVIDIKS